MQGIYKITNTNNGKVYVGQTKDITIRRIQHFTALGRGTHENKSMQSDFTSNSLGWVFEVLEECPLSLLNTREKYWIAFYKSADPQFGYNQNKGGGPRKRKYKGRPTSLLDEWTDTIGENNG